jgi:WD40 repeat protein
MIRATATWLVLAVAAVSLVDWAEAADAPGPATRPAAPPGEGGGTGGVVRIPSGDGRAQIVRLALSPDGKRLAVVRRVGVGTARDYWALSMYSLPDAKELPPLIGRAGPGEKDEDPASCEEVRFAPDGKVLLTIAEPHMRRILRVYDPVKRADVYKFESKFYGVTPCAFSPDSKFVLHGARNGPGGSFSMDLIDLATGKATRHFSPPMEELQYGQLDSLSFSPDGKRFAYSQGEWLSVWDVESGKETYRLKCATKEYTYVIALAFTPDSKELHLTEQGGVVWWLDLASGKRSPRIGHGVPNTVDPPMAFSADGRHLLVAEPGRIVLRDADSGEEVSAIKHGPTPRSIAFPETLRDGKVVVDVEGRRDGHVAVVTLPPAPDRPARDRAERD